MIEFDAIPRLKRFLVCLLLAIVSGFTFHLDMMGETIDSLYTIYINTPSAQQLEAANQVFQQLHKAEFTDSLIQFNESAHQDDVEVHLHYWMAEYYYANGLFDDSYEACERALQLISVIKDDHFKSDLLGIVANTQFRIGNYDEALKTQIAAYQIDKKLGEDDLISSDLNSFAAIYLAAKQPIPGIKCIEEAIALERKLNRPERIAIRLGLASELYLLNKEYDKAIAAVEEAYQIDNGDGRLEKAAIRLVQKGAVLEAMSRYDEAYSTERQALSILEKTNNAYSLAVCYNQLGRISNQLSKPQDAIAYYKKALEYSIKCGSPNVECTAERGLWETMRDDNPTIALLHLERYTALNDSLNNRLTAARLAAFDPHNTTIGTDFMKDSQQQHSYLLRFAMVILGIMLIVMLTALFHAWRKNRSALAMSQQTQELRSHFLNNITRELHTPLTVIMNAGQQLLYSSKTSPNVNKRIGEMIINYGQSMLELVNQLIDIEKVKTASEQNEIRTGNIVMFVRMLVDNFRDSAQEHLISLQFSSPLQSVVTEFPPDNIRKIVHILISNAIHYTPRNGRIDVTMDLIESNKLRLMVADTGRGIPVEERERIFEPFSQSENGDNGVKTVLELSMVNYLVQALNGTISVDSELGVGTTITITLPVQHNKNEDIKGSEIAPHFADRQLIPESNGKKQKPLVFIVENNEDVLLFIADHLKDDYNLRFAHDGKEAFDNALDLIPELIITNMIIPVMDGKELIRQIRQSKTLSHIPVIAMTTNTSEHERLSCLEAGADGVLVKPFNSREMELMVKHIIKQRIALRERIASTNADNKTQDVTARMSKEDKEFIHRLVDVIQAQMANADIDMEHIAAALSLSRKQLRTRVMAVTGLTPVAYVLQVRLNYARRMILNEDTSLTTIASRCGFQNLSHFSKAFKQQYGLSPLQFRKSVDNFGPP